MHPQTGEICLDILKNAWSPAWTLHSVCQAIVALMSGEWGTLRRNPHCILHCCALPVWQAHSKLEYGTLAQQRSSRVHIAALCPARRAADSAPDSPLNCDAGNLLRGGDIRGYNSLARMYTLELAMPPQ